ncbi:general stress protein [Viridibacillus sp. FSL R5-0477]|uniref:General stress protein 17M n=1 Tax=Viridibacillus arenosi FSL R5-213 TaxID=1227360 RepID=W4F6I1_9BACL|nr:MULTISPECIES: general stress protein [Viridibacillus]ETT87909.1 general stress protein 17M [Viridibacillus arenosi FSL R5-213]OMC81642.1 general stress protein [Viridibacillus sp. FSL H8-0123]OMC87541.1 general stress protein [Viridibacillus arenosi]OMC89187.1 general stress protein [Viridibacillus sp. FSL H7-0596]
MTLKLTVENAVQALEEIKKLELQGHSRDDIYVFAHFKERSDDINKALDTAEVGIKEQGILNSMKNMFTSRGDELRNKMEAAGLTKEEAANAEEELDQGKLIIIAN